MTEPSTQGSGFEKPVVRDLGSEDELTAEGTPKGDIAFS
jgi:hypothetical protein